MDSYDLLMELSNELLPYYDIDKVKPYGVYVWTKGETDTENVFDIYSNEIVFYENHEIIKDALPIIEKIQEHLIKMENQTQNNL